MKSTETEKAGTHGAKGSVNALRNVLANWGAFVINAGVGFLLSPYIVHHLGNVEYGLWVLLTSLVGYLGLLDLGVRGAVMRFVAHLHASGRDDEAGSIASAGFALFGTLGSIAICAGVGLSWAAGRLFEIPPVFLGVARIVLVLGGLNIATALISGVFGGIITARQRFDISSSVEITMTLLRTGAVITVLALGHGLIALATVQLGCSVIRCAIDAIISRRLYPELRFGVRSFSRGHVRQLLGFSAYMSILHASNLVLLQMDAVVIGAFLPVAMITYFSMASSLTDYARSVASGISQTIPPRVSALQGIGEVGNAAQVGLQTARIATLAVFPVVIAFLIRGSSFIGLWMGSAYADLAGRVLFVLSLLLWTYPARQVLGSTLVGLNRHRVLVPIQIAEAIANLGLSVVLVRPLGIVGVAWGTTIPGLVASAIMIPLAFCRVFDIRFRDVWWDLWVRPVAAMVPFALALIAIARPWEPTTLIGFFGQILLVLPVAAAGAWIVGLTPRERRIFARAIPRARHLAQHGSAEV